MNFINFTGNKKTKSSFLNQIKNISKDTQSLIDNLQSLAIFEICTPVRKGLVVEESPNSFRMKMNSKGKKSVTANFPNIFGRGESFSLDFSGFESFTAQFGKPFICGNQIVHSKFLLNREERENSYFNRSLQTNNESSYSDNVKDSSKNKKVVVNKGELITKFDLFTLKLGIENFNRNLFSYYTQTAIKILGFKIDSKVGYSMNEKIVPFCKLIVSKKLGLSGDNLFIDSTTKVGKLYGNAITNEKFYLGDNLKGYGKSSIGPMDQNKITGGISFIEIKNRLGFYLGNLQVYGFGEVCVNTAKGLKESFEVLKDFGDNNCIGKSIGIGIGTKNKKGPSFIFAVPFTSNPEAEKYSFGIDFEF